MAFFKYVAVDANNNTIEAITELANRNAVLEALSKQNLRAVSVKEVKSATAGMNTEINLFKRTKVKNDQLVMFTRQLSAMVGAGVPLLRALGALRDNQPAKSPLKEILGKIVEDVEGGATLSGSMAKYPKVFNDIYVNMVRAGESAGILDDILNRLAAKQENSMKMRKKIKSSMSYPIVLLCITVIAFFGLMIFVMPKIGSIVYDLSGGSASLPMITLVMLGISSFTVKYWYLIIGGAFLLVFAFNRYTHTKVGHYQWHKLLIHMPIAKNLVVKYVIANFARTFSALNEAGVAVLESLHVTAHAVGNDVYEQAILDAAEQVKNGRTLSSVIAKNPLFPPIVSQMLAVGEETGQTGKVLVKIADFYEEEIDSSISGLSAIIEPVMLVIMGSVVGLIAASVMLPISQLAQDIK